MNVSEFIQQSAREKRTLFSVLIDPDKYSFDSLDRIMDLSVRAGVDLFFFGGSLLLRDQQEEMISRVKSACKIPVVLFPGNNFQVTDKADALLFLSLVSGRNPEFLIGKHVVAAPYLKATGMEVIPTGYLLIDGGSPTTVEYMSNTRPIPSAKNEIAVCTALAGEFLGMDLIYMDAGSGAKNPVPEGMIRAVKENISVPLIIGGGITSPEQAQRVAHSGADVVVVGNILEKQPDLVLHLSQIIHQ
jgi:putative glycerol-1-phosphate prenyltransferase